MRVVYFISKKAVYFVRNSQYSTVQYSTFVSTRNCDLHGKSLRFIAVYRIIPIECLILFFFILIYNLLFSNLFDV